MLSYDQWREAGTSEEFEKAARSEVQETVRFLMELNATTEMVVSSSVLALMIVAIGDFLSGDEWRVLFKEDEWPHAADAFGELFKSARQLVVREQMEAAKYEGPTH